DGFFRSRYYLGENNSEALWGYVELLIVLEVFMLTDSMKVYEFLRGENINELLSFILEKENDIGSENMQHLITRSYNYDKEKENHLSYLDLNDEEKKIGIRRIFVPVDGIFENKSIFSDSEIF